MNLSSYQFKDMYESLAVKLSKRLIGATLPTMGLDYGDLESL